MSYDWQTVRVSLALRPLNTSPSSLQFDEIELLDRSEKIPNPTAKGILSCNLPDGWFTETKEWDRIGLCLQSLLKQAENKPCRLAALESTNGCWKKSQEPPPPPTPASLRHHIRTHHHRHRHHHQHQSTTPPPTTSNHPQPPLTTTATPLLAHHQTHCCQRPPMTLRCLTAYRPCKPVYSYRMLSPFEKARRNDPVIGRVFGRICRWCKAETGVPLVDGYISAGPRWTTNSGSHAASYEVVSDEAKAVRIQFKPLDEQHAHPGKAKKHIVTISGIYFDGRQWSDSQSRCR